ncbi:MAG: DUF2752 domain-containing protein [Clostridia bacterium]
MKKVIYLKAKCDKRIINIVILLVEIILFTIVVILKVPLECMFQRYFHIACPGCGMTRAFLSILELDFISAIRYNILSVPIFAFLCIMSAGLIKDIIQNTSTTLEKAIKMFKKYSIVIILALIASFIYNII